MTNALAPDSPIVGLAAELKRQLETKRDLIANTRRINLIDSTEGGLGIGVDLPDGLQDFTVTDHAHGQIGTHLGIPSKLYRRLLDAYPDLLEGLANGLLSREPSKRMLRTMDGKVRGFLSNKYRPRDNWDLLDQAILPALKEYDGRGLYFKECSLTDTRMYVKVVLPDFERPITPKVGDVIRGGLIVRNSEVGAGSLVIAPYTDRLICTNGMVHTDFGQSSRHVGKRIESTEEAWELYSDETLRLDDAAFFAKCADTVRNVLSETVFEGIVAQMRDLAGIRLEKDPVEAVAEVTKRHDFTEAESSSILTALIEGADLSAWGMVNAVTQTARDLESPDRRVDLEHLAGRMVSDPTLVAV